MLKSGFVMVRLMIDQKSTSFWRLIQFIKYDPYFMLLGVIVSCFREDKARVSSFNSDSRFQGPKLGMGRAH